MSATTTTRSTAMGKGAFSSLAYRKNRDRGIELILLTCALVAVFTTLAIVGILIVESSYFLSSTV